ncbi:MAG: PKD domain-containing protein [Candidatus Cloacimonetes bacterium]|nr:PKD domain-containing protein [Candidatus Cloacimonadota bacterium]
MKKTVIYFLFILLFQLTIADDFQRPILKPIDRKIQTHRNNITKNRNSPEIEFSVDPVDIMVSFYDYMPGSYCKNPMQTQPENSQPYGYPAGGNYIAFHATENSSPSAQRKVFYAYIDSEGELIITSTITANDTREGFPGLDIDPVTGDPFITWHNVVEIDDTYDCSMSYDLYHVYGEPGHWREPFISIDNPEDSQPSTGYDDDAFIWSRVKVGPSPIESKRRIYIMGNNYSINSAGATNYNILVGIADFDSQDLEQPNELEFIYFSFPEWDNLHYNNIGRLLKDFAIADDGKVAFVGYYGVTWCMQYSTDYGATWSYYEADAKYDLENPLNEDGSSLFVNDDGTPAELFVYPSEDGSHFNALFDKNNEKIIAMGAFGINTEENFENGFYMPAMFYPKIYNYSIENGELVVDVIDLYIEGVDPNDGIPMIPWDLDEDGFVDEFTDEGYISFVTSVASWSWLGDAQDAFFHESLFKIAKVENYFIAIWQDAENVYHNYYEEPGYESWEAKPEIAIAVSADNGVHWSQPAFMNANSFDDNYFEELEGMTPAYVYIADEIKIVAETLNSVTLEVPIFFMDDFSYGSFIQGEGANEGGMLTYAKLEVCYQFTDFFANFQTNLTAGLAPLSIQFNDTSGGNVSSWEWDFDNDGTIDSNLQNPEHIYLESGNYSVSLSIDDPVY